MPTKNILLAVTGGIAAYKSAILVRRLKDAGFDYFTVFRERKPEFVRIE
jgi:phosphopantothenoylcysteine decarboxylase/phosphopantothenate--cysteine ligase